ncbi:tetratricopeptide repeat protein [Paraburkholderia graminis]|uniref:tetratricopeptide repeat protein n=1 Tax=Paraburkholderia graminis TaxID=60548 RepID=UPI00278FB057|nr:tetratricopeptide repeat protein [Paraburkholderia graminis]MDQ0627137.1 tetratricopeptide (TPR) repeat protein [Paraburkholderia graminis]
MVGLTFSWRSIRLCGTWVFAVATTVSTVLIVTWFIALLVSAVFSRHALDVRVITVPKGLDESGFTSTTASQRLRDAIYEVEREAKTGSRISVSLSSDLPDLVIPKAGIPLESVANAIRTLLPDSWQHQIAGEILPVSGGFSLRIRLNGRVVYSGFASNQETLDAALYESAVMLVETTEPIIAASEHYEREDYPAALRLADRVIATSRAGSPEYVSAIEIKVLVDEHQGNYEEAKYLIATLPNEESIIQLAVLQRSEGHVKDAIETIRRALTADPKSWLAHYEFGNLLVSEGRLDDAMVEFKKAVAIEPQDGGARWMIGYILEKKGDVTGAIAVYREINRVKPHAAQPYVRIASMEQMRGLDNDALSDLKEASRQEPLESAIHFSIARTYDKLGKRDTAISEYKLAFNSGNAGPAHHNLGNIYLEQGKVQQAESEYRAALRLLPESAETLSRLCAISILRNKYDDAHSQCLEAIRVSPHNGHAHEQLGILWLTKEKNEYAVEEFRLAIDLDQTSALARHNLGRALWAQGKAPEAADQFRRAIALDSKFGLPHYNLALIMAAQGSARAALDEFKAAIRLAPNNSALHFQLGKFYQQRDCMSEAVAEFDEALRLYPASVVARDALASVRRNGKKKTGQTAGKNSAQSPAVDGQLGQTLDCSGRSNAFF